MRHIFLYGPPGSGKSVVGRTLAGLLDLPFLDLDLEIERDSGASIPELMGKGEEYFRDIEGRALTRVVNQQPGIIALGGGALLREGNRRVAEESGAIIFLEGDLSRLLENISHDETKRPLLEGDSQGKLSLLLEKRKEHYASFPNRIQLNRSSPSRPGKTPEDAAYEIMWTLNLMRVRSANGKNYDVIVRPNGLDSLGGLMQSHQLGGPVVLIADDQVADLYGIRALASLQGADYQAQLLTFPAGEGSKTVETASKLWQEMVEAGLDRKGTVVALGGGVSGDLAGFAAATFMRGVRWVGVPSTLLAMVDSSLGGKTGFDLPQGKNLVGAFHDPDQVLVDPRLLDTLPPREFASGMAEVVKHGMIGDPELFHIVQHGLDFCKQHLVDLICRAITVKIRIVESDPFEQGVRATLNLGHTIGHAVEKTSGYRLLHGEAISIGMVAESILAETLGIARQGLTQELISVLSGMGLPFSIPEDISEGEIIKAMKVDKKKAAGAIRFALPVDVGSVKAGVEISDLESVLKSGSRENIQNFIRQSTAREAS